MRADYNDHFGLEWVPQAGATFTPSVTTTVKAIISKGFRNPTIREMYMFPPQNPDLQAERLMNYEVSASHYLHDNALLLNLNLFYIEGDNMIQTLPVGGKMKNRLGRELWCRDGSRLSVNESTPSFGQLQLVAHEV